MSKNTKEWYTSWFDTPFYHILYKDRDDTEAHAFPEHGTILDLACGKGRHALYLNKIGYNVTGVDLSKNSIDYAKQFENNTLKFDVHDMCKPYHSQFDTVVNLFTSFGYFDNEIDNLKTIKAIKANLNDTGFGVIDFMNSDYIINNLVPEEIKTVDNIEFHIKRYVKDNYIIKEISFKFDKEYYNFHERVRAFTIKDFENLFKKAGVYLLDVFGDYKLNKFNPYTSERLVLIFK